MIFVEIKGGDHVPLIPFVEIFESNGATEFWQRAPIFANKGSTIGTLFGI